MTSPMQRVDFAFAVVLSALFLVGAAAAPAAPPTAGVTPGGPSAVATDAVHGGGGQPGAPTHDLTDH